jgi:hypothetical protein
MDATDGPAQPLAVPTLRDLIDRHTDRTNESRRSLGDRSGIAHQTLGYWWAGTIKNIPEPETIRLFAKFTHYSEQTVLLAAARTVGLRVSESGTPLMDSLPPGTDNLEPADVEAVRAVVRQLVDARRAAAPTPDLATADGILIAEEEEATADTPERRN